MGRFVSDFFNTAKSLVKIVLLSRRPTAREHCCKDGTLVIMGNGPSLADVISGNGAYLKEHDLMAVNFAANAPEFRSLAPQCYILADPHFFIPEGTDVNVDRLWRNLQSVDWPMTLYVPAKYRDMSRSRLGAPAVDVRTFNPVGVGGFRWFRNLVYRKGLGMPRPRNVLVPAIMTGVLSGYRTIVLVGADHSWMRTLWVSDDNEVVSVQPHFYKEDEKEEMRVRHEYKGYRLHQIVESFAIAFRSYHEVEAFARSYGVDIFNATPGSFIDAFRRLEIKD